MEQEQQTPGQRALQLIVVLLPNGRPTTQDVLRWIRFALAVAIMILGVLLILAVVSSIFDTRLWKLLKALALPITVGAAVPWLNWLQKKREQAVEDQRAQDGALQAYLDKMAELLTDGHLHEKADQYDTTRITARARALAVLSQLDGKRKRTVLLFLREARLINRYDYLDPDDPQQRHDVRYYAHYVGLGGADLSGADLDRARLISTSGKEPISLKGANLKDAKMSEAILRGADLSGVDLSGADLRKADLRRADLSKADLSEADLRLAELSKADPAKVDLSDADLSGADLNGAIQQQLKALTRMHSWTKLPAVMC
jgi:uncharacterized protein YjbI with pentapeptide repeats